jgi:hypothetical protein
VQSISAIADINNDIPTFANMIANAFIAKAEHNVADGLNGVHVETVIVIVFWSNQFSCLPADSADIEQTHDFGNLVVGAGRGACKKCHCPIR